jgi:hypothetical protein
MQPPRGRDPDSWPPRDRRRPGPARYEPAGRTGHRRQGPRSVRKPGARWGSLRGTDGVLIVFGSVGLGLIFTVLAGSDPGLLLGIFLIIGTVAAVLAVRPRAVHLTVPAPAFAYLAAAIIAGLIHDRAVDTSRTALAISALQWVASGFLAMTAATVLAIVATIVRRPRRRRNADVAADSAPADWG